MVRVDREITWPMKNVPILLLFCTSVQGDESTCAIIYNVLTSFSLGAKKFSLVISIAEKKDVFLCRTNLD